MYKILSSRAATFKETERVLQLVLSNIKFRTEFPKRLVDSNISIPYQNVIFSLWNAGLQ